MLFYVLCVIYVIYPLVYISNDIFVNYVGDEGGGILTIQSTPKTWIQPLDMARTSNNRPEGEARVGEGQLH